WHLERKFHRTIEVRLGCRLNSKRFGPLLTLLVVARMVSFSQHLVAAIRKLQPLCPELPSLIRAQFSTSMAQGRIERNDDSSLGASEIKRTSFPIAFFWKAGRRKNRPKSEIIGAG